MKVFVSQLNIQPGVSFPFSHVMQSLLHETLSALAVPSPAFTDKYGADFNLIVRLSAKREPKQNEIKGPTVFKKEKEVEYTLFLPFEAIIEQVDIAREAGKGVRAEHRLTSWPRRGVHFRSEQTHQWRPHRALR
jgi:hypothetical protein